MVLLDLTKHIERGNTKGILSPVTVANYNKAMRYVGVQFVESESFDDLCLTLSTMIDAGRSKGLIEIFVALVFATAKLYHMEVRKGIHLTGLSDKIAMGRRGRSAYSTEDVKLILKTADPGSPLFKLLVLLSMAGLRVSAAEGIRLMDIKPVKEVPGTYYFMAKRKGKGEYPAIVGDNAKGWLEYAIDSEEEPLCPYSRHRKGGTFDNSYRSKFVRFVSDNNLQGIFKKEGDRGEIVAFHSLRRWHERQLFAFGASETDINLLSGRMPGTVLFKNYLTDKGDKMPVDIVRRSAEAYAKSSLVNFSFMEEP